ncbi:MULTISPECIES: hypothetical protein [unclassified Mycoplasma]|uniref:hypothetical protein n=1 Tax=unclassified Mycoplasma TaxID=2683645 RepID=UPI00211CF8F9|nr:MULTISPECIES: hypothetical protein [unclassified Mycoplasma]UUM20039.1 hypothetical protein NPA11_01265 [Mycoplasma sp. 1578d]UUM25019.1 hypothetical protein NPA12_01240 [Mycoplasma sp. 3686d]
MKQFLKNNTVDATFLFFLFPIWSILAIGAYWHAGSFFGFAIGSLIAYLSTKINVVISLLLNPKMHKQSIIRLIIIKNIIFFIIIGIVIYLSVQINSIYAGKNQAMPIFKWEYINNPINLIALLIGTMIIIPIYALESVIQQYLVRRWNE